MVELFWRKVIVQMDVWLVMWMVVRMVDGDSDLHTSCNLRLLVAGGQGKAGDGDIKEEMFECLQNGRPYLQFKIFNDVSVKMQYTQKVQKSKLKCVLRLHACY